MMKAHRVEPIRVSQYAAVFRNAAMGCLLLTDRDSRAVNAEIARNYDAFIYESQPRPLLDVSRICGAASVFGPIRYPSDILDLGCGSGSQLASVMSQVSGRGVGIDISPEHCRRAQARIAPFADRTRIICGDLLEIDPEALGEFDIIYCIGVIYVTPPEVQRRIVEMICRCLRPGGVAVMSYYAGSVPVLRANLHRTLRAECSGLEPASAIAKARSRLDEIGRTLEGAPSTDMLRHAISDTSRLSDLIFFHEVLNNAFDPVQTSAIAGTLSQHGVGFASYLPPLETGDGQSSMLRAVAADLADFIRGEYRHAVFVRWQGPSKARFAARPSMWESRVTRHKSGELLGEQKFFVDGTDTTVSIRNPAATAMFDCLIDGPHSWSELISHVSKVLERAGIDFDARATVSMENGLRQMWRHGLAIPLLAPERNGAPRTDDIR
jgi:SAM-dependent methyltransferase